MGQSKKHSNNNIKNYKQQGIKRGGDMGYIKRAIIDFWNHVPWYNHNDFEYMADYLSTYHGITKTPAQIRKIAQSIKE